MDAFTELDKDRKIIVVADNEEVLAAVKAFIKENNLDESLIGYRIESFEDMVPSDSFIRCKLFYGNDSKTLHFILQI